MRNIFAVVVASCLSICGSAGTAFAQAPLVLQKLKEWNAAAPAPSNDVLIAQVKGVAAQKYPDNGRCLAQGLTLVDVKPATAERYVFKEVIYHRMRNAWTVVARHPGCDSAPVRYMVMQKIDGSFDTIRVNRGTSYAHDSLIGDVFGGAVIVALPILSKASIPCGKDLDAKLGVIRIDKEEPGLGPDVFGVRYSGSWTEIWPIEKCGRVVEVPVRFTADGDGGAYFSNQGTRAVLLPASPPGEVVK